MKDFFISYTSADRDWAEWVAVALSNAGQTLVIQAWDFVPGSNWMLEMHRATMGCSKTIVILSPNWLASVFTQPEWAAAMSLDPTGANRKLIPVRVRLCEPPGLLRTIVYCDLVGLEEERARKALLLGVREPGPRPTSAPFPAQNNTAPNPSGPEKYPGVALPAPPVELPSTVQVTLSLLTLLRTTRTTFEAQVRLRDKLVLHLENRLILNPYELWEFEDFIASHYKDLDEEEKRLFSTMRSFTSNVLHDYNRRTLELIDRNPALAGKFQDVTALRDHLILWLAKYEGTFLNSPDMCLLYTGVSEGVPFPRQLETTLWKSLEGNPAVGDLLRAEPTPSEEFEEHSSSDRHYLVDDRLFCRWIRRIFNEIAEEREHLLSGAAPPAGQRTMERLAALDTRETELLCMGRLIWGPVQRPLALIAALTPLVESAKANPWPEEFRKALSFAIPVINNPGLDANALKKLLAQFPAISAYVESLHLPCEVITESARLRNEIKNSTLARMPAEYWK